MPPEEPVTPPPTPPAPNRWSQFRSSHWYDFLTETRVIVALFLLATSLFVFIEITDEVMENETRHIDETILLWFRNPADVHESIGPGWLKTVMMDITALGGTTVLVAILLITLGSLWITKKYKAMLLIAVAAVGGQVFNSTLKFLFMRPRPEIVPHLTEVHTPSFPSGHSMMSAIIYLTLAALLSLLVKQRRLQVYMLSVAMLLTALIGFSRVFLGVHYPTDVVAGWTAGLAWALLCLLFGRLLQRRGAVEPPRNVANGEEASDNG